MNKYIFRLPASLWLPIRQHICSGLSLAWAIPYYTTHDDSSIISDNTWWSTWRGHAMAHIIRLLYLTPDFTFDDGYGIIEIKWLNINTQWQLGWANYQTSPSRYNKNSVGIFLLPSRIHAYFWQPTVITRLGGAPLSVCSRNRQLVLV